MLGHMNYHGKGGLAVDHAKALECYRKATARGDHDARLTLANFHEHGVAGLAADLAEAARLRRPVREAAADGNADQRETARELMQRLG